jgi:hypothetical protein
MGPCAEIGMVICWGKKLSEWQLATAFCNVENERQTMTRKINESGRAMKFL